MVVCVLLYVPFLFLYESLISLKRFLKFVFKAFYSDQAFGDFLGTFNTFSAICKKDRLTKVLSLYV